MVFARNIRTLEYLVGDYFVFVEIVDIVRGIPGFLMLLPLQIRFVHFLRMDVAESPTFSRCDCAAKIDGLLSNNPDFLQTDGSIFGSHVDVFRID